MSVLFAALFQVPCTELGTPKVTSTYMQSELGRLCALGGSGFSPSWSGRPEWQTWLRHLLGHKFLICSRGGRISVPQVVVRIK